MNYYFSTGGGINSHATYIPNSFRMLIVGSSNCGKTTLLMRLLLEPKLLNYDKVYIYSMSLQQPEYQVLRLGIENHLTKKNILLLLNSGELIEKYRGDEIEEPTLETVALGLAETQKKESNLQGEFYNNVSDIPDPSDLDTSIRNLMIFDDLMDKSQVIQKAYFTRGRHGKCDSIYIVQNYTSADLQTIRTNANFLIFFKSSPFVIEHLYRTYYSADNSSIADFKRLCKLAWQRDYGYLVIDLTRKYSSGNKYRMQLELN